MMTRINTLQVDQLSVFTPSSTRLLNNIDCALAGGEIMAIIGPNGAGKSSLISAITGELAVTGAITLNGIADNGAERARQLAILPQSNTLDFPFRVEEVVGLARIPHRSGVDADNIIIQQALALMDISYLQDRRYTELSGGEKQRVQLARVFAQIWRAEDAGGARLLLLDEPTATLDLGHQHSFMQALREFAAQGVAIAMVVHDVNLAARYADKVLALLCGDQVAFGDAEHVMTADVIQRLFQLEVDIIRHPESNTPMLIDR